MVPESAPVGHPPPDAAGRREWAEASPERAASIPEPPSALGWRLSDLSEPERAEMLAHVAAERAAQGLPPYETDALALRAIARLLRQ